MSGADLTIGILERVRKSAGKGFGKELGTGCSKAFLERNASVVGSCWLRADFCKGSHSGVNIEQRCTEHYAHCIFSRGQLSICAVVLKHIAQSLVK